MFNAKDYGALGDGKALDSVAIQKAIDACYAVGGGTVYIPEGKYVCGTMHIKSNIHVLIDKGAVILGSKDYRDFDPYEENPANNIYQDINIKMKEITTQYPEPTAFGEKAPVIRPFCKKR